MRRLTFRKYWEATDIFGFDKERNEEGPGDDGLLMRPITQFNFQEMFDLLKQKKIGTFHGEQTFPNVMQWGNQPGCIKLDISPTYGISVRKLGIDKGGNHRWVTCKYFQLNRNGFGGYEDAVAQEVWEQLMRVAQRNIEAPTEDYKELNSLVDNIYHKLKRTSKRLFIPEGVKKIHDDAYIIKFGLTGQGLQARDQQRVEQNQVLVSYDRSQGTIRITDYNIVSRVGKAHEFKINYLDLDHYFFPTQDRDEISEVVAVKLKYY